MLSDDDNYTLMSQGLTQKDSHGHPLKHGNVEEIFFAEKMPVGSLEEGKRNYRNFTMREAEALLKGKNFSLYLWDTSVTK